MSDDRASRINIYLMFGTQVSRTCFTFFMIYPLNSYVDLLIFLGYSLSVAILGCHSLFLFSITFNLSANVYFLKYLLANLLIQVWYLLAGLYVTCTISCLFLMLAVQNFLLKFNYCNYLSLDLFLLKYVSDCLVHR